MTTCFIKWDNSYSYKLANPDNNFSIINVQGVPQKIIWDGGGSGKEHIINNPLNYSYSFKALAGSGGRYRFSNISETKFLFFTLVYNVGLRAFWSSSQATEFWLSDSTNRFLRTSWNGNTMTFTIDPTSKEYGNYFSTQLTPETLDGKTGKPSGQYQNLFDVGGDIIKIYGSQWKIIIKDNNINYEYNIIDRNSVQIIYSQGGKKIQIEGNQYDIIDANSAYKDCDKHCPNGLIECQCGNQLCCYKKTNSGYELVQTINL